MASSASREPTDDSSDQPETTSPGSPPRGAQQGTADNNTPFRAGSAQRSKESSRNSQPVSRSASAAPPTNTAPATPIKSTQLQMDYCLQKEMLGSIFCDPNFVDNFLNVQKDHWSLLFKNPPKWKLDDRITAEHSLYTPILSVLCSIKNTADTFRKSHGLDTLGTTFCDTHSEPIKGDDPDSRLIKPDLVLFEGNAPNQRSWETLLMPIEVKSKHTHLKVGMKQLTRYARAVFAHQIHRRHVYGMVICKWAATFVRFDRSGIVHSEPIDMLHNPEEFRRAFAGLMMLDKRAFGYDTAFTTRVASSPGAQHWLDYYVDIPTTAFPLDNTEPKSGSGEPENIPNPDSNSQTPARKPLPSRRFKVMERLCHRKSIRSRATIVLRLREVRERIEQPEPRRRNPERKARKPTQPKEPKEPVLEEVLEGPEYVLKLMWRDPRKRQEGEALKRLEGEYGLVQCQWHSDVLQWGAHCHEPGATTCVECRDMTPAQAGLRQVKNLGDLDVKVADEEDGLEPVYVEVDTNGFVGKPYTERMPRIYYWALFSTVGRLLWTAETPSLFLEAVRDGILGYWGAFNRGVLHRDISNGNVFIAEPGQGYSLRNWQHLQEAINSIPDQPAQQTAAAVDHPFTESRRLAREKVEQLGRDPRGLLGDFDLFATHGGMEDEFFGPPPNQKALDVQTPTSATDDVPLSKRSRGGINTSVSESDKGTSREASQSENPNFSPNLGRDSKDYRLIDFRTGTPTFMSIRVLKTPVGQPYEHHFMDDLESFFWLILWCVIEHTDPDPEGNGNNGQPTNEAVAMLSVLDRADSDFLTLAHSKSGLMLDCQHGDIRNSLAACQNTWANNQALVQVIERLGDYFLNHKAKKTPLSSFKPEIEFPCILNIISEALSAMDPGPASTPPEA